MARIMINKAEVGYSEKYLWDFFKSLNPKQRKNVGLIGGWAVHLFLEKLGIDHIGSRDIDIFFNPKEIDFQNLIKRVESKEFQPHSTFRWAKYIQFSTQKELTESQSKKVPVYDLITIYFDIACPKKIDRRVMHIPILEKIFEKDSELVKFKNLDILIPSSRILIEMKLNSATKRTDRFKREKDLADLFALLYYDDSNWIIKNGKKMRTKKISRKLVKEFQKNMPKFTRDGTIINASNMIKVSPESIIDLFKRM